MDNFRNAIINFNKQLTLSALRTYRLNKIKNAKPDTVIIVGMGGSGQVGNIIANLRSELKIPVPVFVCKDYIPPHINFKNPLFIFISFSGNTQEVISYFNKTKGLRAIVCAGGKMEKLANNLPLVIIPADNLLPRQANGYLFYGVTAIIKEVFPKIKIPTLNNLKPASIEPLGKKIANLLKNKIIIIYSSHKNKHLNYIWKTNLNETAKALAFNNTIPEATHNEIVSFQKPDKNIFVLFIKDPKDFPLVNKNMNVLEKILKNKKISTLKIELIGKNELEKTWNNIILAFWTSYHLAKIKKIDPSKTEIIDAIKELMD